MIHQKDPRPAGCGTWLLFIVGVIAYLVLACLNSNAITFAPSAPARPASHKAQSYPDMHAPGQHAIAGAPTISARLIDRVLCAAHSPACGTGRDLYRQGLAYGIDPAYTLAFFKHESSYGRYGMARSTLSLGNIRCTPGYACSGGYRAYSSWQAGYEDWYKLIRSYIRAGLATIEQIIPVYAPSTENDTSGYIRSILAAVATWRQEVQA